MTALKYYGSTSNFSRVRPGVILKSPTKVWKESPDYEELTTEFAYNFLVERKMFNRLGEHPRIVRYIGYQDNMSMQRGLLLAEASHGNLQQYIDENNSFISLSLRKKWCRQTAESIAYLYSRGVIHSDLRPDNFLVHATSTASQDIWLCDFGGSICEELGLDGGISPTPASLILHRETCLPYQQTYSVLDLSFIPSLQGIGRIWHLVYSRQQRKLTNITRR